MKNSKPNCPLCTENEKVTVETTNQNKQAMYSDITNKTTVR